MTVVAVAVLALFTVSVVGLLLVCLNDSEQPDREEEAQDDAWIVELRRLNEAMPRVRKHRARVAALKKGR